MLESLAGAETCGAAYTARLLRTLADADGVPRAAYERGVLAGEPLFHELGDYLPLLAFWGEEALCRRQLRAVAAWMEQGYPLRREGRPSRHARAFTYSDLCFGLLDFHTLTGDPAALALACAAIERVQALFWSERLSSFWSPAAPCPPLLVGEDATYVEILVRLHRRTGDARWLVQARELLAAFRGSACFARYGLVPHYVLSTSPARWLVAACGRAPLCEQRMASRFVTSQVLKDNSAFGFALAAAYEAGVLGIERADLARWLASILAHHGVGGGSIAQRVLLRPRGIERRERGSLLASFAVIDVCLELHAATSERSYLEAAEQVAASWLARQSPVTGLVPEQDDGDVTYLDALTDFGVCLLRLAERTGHARYGEAGLRLGEGMLRFHAPAGLLVRRVHVTTGVVVDATVVVKYNFLFLKLLAAFRLFHAGRLERSSHLLSDR